MYYHVRISTRSNQSHDETKVDLNSDQLYERVIQPYEAGESIFINGKNIEGNDLSRIKISRSEQPSSRIIDQLRSEDQHSAVVFVGGPSYEWRAADRSEDVTDELLKGAFGYKKVQSKLEEKKAVRSNKKVFVVHGHDENLKNDIEAFLHNIYLDPIILHKQPDEGLTIIEKFEKNSDVTFAIILLTPDDLSCSSSVESNEIQKAIKPCARQNVIFEFGYFIGKLGRKNVCCIYKEGVELPSDVSGLLYKKFSNDIEEIGFSLIKEFRTAGLEPKI